MNYSSYIALIPLLPLAGFVLLVYLEENILKIHPGSLEQVYYWHQQYCHYILLTIIFLLMEKLDDVYQTIIAV